MRGLVKHLHEAGVDVEIITAIREVILDNVAFIESALDDPEHFDINDNVDKMTKDVDNCVDKVDKLLKTSDNGRIMRDGIRTVILGKTNAGKSSKNRGWRDNGCKT